MISLNINLNKKKVLWLGTSTLLETFCGNIRIIHRDIFR